MSELVDLVVNLHWQRPLWLLAVPLLLIALLIRRRTSANGSNWSTHIDRHLLQALLVSEESREHRLSRPRIDRLLTVGGVLTALALAGPAWDKSPQPLYESSAQTIIIADMTLSMHATDLKPSRLVQLKFKLRELLKTLKEGRVALIAYSGDAHLVAPLTEDNAAIENLVAPLAPEIIPSIGSNPERAFELAIEMIEKNPEPTRILFFTDEVLGASARKIRQQLSAMDSGSLDSIEIIVVGTASGSPIRLPSGRFLQDPQGNIVSAPVDFNRLSSFASSINARVTRLSSDNSDIARLARDSSRAVGAPSESENSNQVHARWNDRGGWIALLVIPFFLLFFRRGFVLPCALILALSLQPGQQLLADEVAQERTQSSWWQNLWQTPEQRARDHYEAGEYDLASELFETPGWQGMANMNKGDFESARQNFSQAADALAEQAPEESSAMLYNQAYAEAFSGDITQAINTLEKALELDADFERAREGKAILEELLSQQDNPAQGDQQSGEDQDSSQENQGEQNSGPSDGDGSQQESPAESQPGQKTTSRDEETSDSKSGEEPHMHNEEQLDSQPENPQTGQAESQSDELGAEQSASNTSESRDEDENTGAGQTSEARASTSEQAQAGTEVVQQDQLEAWLNQIDDDPGGLLRRKFEYERALREKEGNVVVDNENQQLW